MSYFRGDFNFCPECGNILPVPGKENTITCPRCSFEIKVQGERDIFNVITCNLWKGFSGCDSVTPRGHLGKVQRKNCVKLIIISII